MQRIELAQLRAHPANANAMEPTLFDKLVHHIERSGRYPPLIVRPMPNDGEPPVSYQVLDGHHRWAALEKLGHHDAACVVWDVDDAEATLLLATLNRLSGRDDPQKRAALLAELHEQHGRSGERLAELLPETAEQVQRWLNNRAKLPKPAEPEPLGRMPVAVHFFLSGDDKRRLETTLASIGGSREAALMTMVDRCESAALHEHKREE